MEKTLLEKFAEAGRLGNLPENDLINLRKDHDEKLAVRKRNYNRAAAQVFEWMQHNDTQGLTNLLKNEPAKFAEWQEAYLLQMESQTHCKKQ